MPDPNSQSSAAPIHPRHIRTSRRSRQRHTKSRNGCYTCKVRRVKCDEARPSCGACSLRGDECAYPTPVQPKYLHTQQQPRARMSLEPLRFNVPDPAVGWEDAEPRPLNMKDLQILQHFLDHTASAMSFHPTRTQVWKRVIPDLAAKEDYLMHLLLALTGAHMISEGELPCSEDNNPGINDRGSIDLPRIFDHHLRGLQGFREALSMLSADTADMVFCGSLLLVGFAFASLRIRHLNGYQSDSGMEDWKEYPRLDWLHLIRGLTSITQQQWFTLKTGRLRSMLFYCYANDDWKAFPPTSHSQFPRLQNCSSRFSRFSHGAEQAVLSLRLFISSLKDESRTEGDASTSPMSQDASSVQSCNSNEILHEQANTIDRLEEMYMRALHTFQFSQSEKDCGMQVDLQNDLEDAAITSWPHLVPETFILSLKTGHDIGLIEGASYTILAHFYLVFVLFEDLWYMKGAFDKEIVLIHHLLGRLQDEKLADLMRWPMDVISY